MAETKGPTITQINEIRALARELNVTIETPQTADQAERQLAALKAYAADG